MLPRYPHLTREDAWVWETWLKDHTTGISEVHYDVALGGVIIEDDTLEEEFRRAWQYQTAVKIDAVVVLGFENLICEIKPVARLSAIGQALGYAILIEEDPINLNANRPMIICSAASAEVRRVAETLQIRIDVVTLPD